MHLNILKLWQKILIKINCFYFYLKIITMVE